MFIRKDKIAGLMETVESLKEEITVSQLRIEDQNWINLSDPHGTKDVTYTDYQNNHALCYQAYMTNPLCKRYVKYISYFTVGKGLSVVAEDTDVQKTLDQFWGHVDNRMKKAAKYIVTETSVYGEIFIRYFYDENLGITRVGLMDPSEIVFIETDPDDVTKPTVFHRRYAVPKFKSVDINGQVSVDYDWKVEAIDAVREKDGLLNLQQVKVGNVSNATRGVSDLLAALKWATRYADWLQDRYIINKIRGLFHYDVTIANGNKNEIKAYLKNLKNKSVGDATEETDTGISEASTSWRIKPGSIRVHSDRIKWDIVAPSIGADDAKEDGRAIKQMFCVAAGLPEHWLGNAGDANLATAKAMDLPTLQQFEDRQDEMEDALTTTLEQVIKCARLYGDLPKPPEGRAEDTINAGFKILFPPLEPKQLTDAATAFKTAVDAVIAAVAGGRISEDTATKILQQYDENVRDWDNEDGEKEQIANERAEVQGVLPGVV